MGLIEKVKKFPSAYGVYIMKDKKGKTLYIGKASFLRKRVYSYFQKNEFSPNKELLLRDVYDIEFIVCDSEAKALLLEGSLIKERKPKFNVVLKDDKSFPFVEITKEDFPCIRVVRKKKKNADYIGPFPQAKDLKKALDLIRKIFPFRTCVKMPKKECLYYHLGLCPGPCSGKITLKDYKKRIKMIKLILQGRRKNIINLFQKEMKKASQEQEYERAQFYRDRLVAISSLYGVRKEFRELLYLKEALGLKKNPNRIEAVDISNTAGQDSTGSVIVFEQGVPLKSQYRRYKIKKKVTDDLGKISEVIERRMNRIMEKKVKRPDLIVIDGGLNQVNTAKNKIDEYKLRIPVIGISKKKEEIWFPFRENSLNLPLNSEALKIVQRLRNEAHRFARKYHLFLRRRSTYKGKK